MGGPSFLSTAAPGLKVPVVTVAAHGHLVWLSVLQRLVSQGMFAFYRMFPAH